MPQKKISQAEAYSLKHRVAALEKELRDQRYAWAVQWPAGVQISRLSVPEWLWWAIHTARKLGHPVVVTTVTDLRLEFYATEKGTKC